MSEKSKKTVSTSKNRIFLNIGFFLIAIIISEKNMNERLLFPQNLLPLAEIKDWCKINFREMEKLIPMEGMFKKLDQNGFH